MARGPGTSQTRIISGDSPEASAWKPPSMGGNDPQSREAAQPAPSVEEIEALQQSAYDEAYAQGRKEGYDSGYGEGLQAGRQQGEREARELVGRIDGVLNGLAAPAEELDDTAEAEIGELALALARQIIRREIQTQPGEVMGVIREAVGLLPMSTRRVRIRLHPDDAVFVRETVGDTEGRWDLVEDPALERGGCLVDTEVSRVDATLEHRVAVLAARAFGDVRRGGEQEERE